MSRSVLAALLLLAAACAGGDRGVVAIGDGIPRNMNSTSFLRVIQDQLDSSRVQNVKIAMWSEWATESIRSDAATAERFAEASDVVTVVGHGGSKGTLRSIPAYSAAGMPLIVPTSTSSQLWRAGPMVFMMSPPDDIEGEFLADAALDSLQGKRIAIIYVADAYGSGIRDGVVARLRSRGAGVVDEAAVSGRECVNMKDLAMRGVVRALLKRAKPDLVILGLGAPQAACVLHMVREVSVDVRILAADSFEPDHPKVMTLTPAQRANVHYVSFWDADRNDQARALVARTHRLIHRDPGAGDALSYDSYLVLIRALAAGHRTREDIAQFMQELGTPGHPPIEGVTGPISFQEPRREIMRFKTLSATP